MLAKWAHRVRMFGFLGSCLLVVGLLLTSSETTTLCKAEALPLRSDPCEQTFLRYGAATKAVLTNDFTDPNHVEPALSLNDALHLETAPSTTAYWHVDSGNNLAQVAQKLRKQNYETAVGFTYFGEKAFDYTNFLPSSVKATASHRQEFLKNHGTLSIHNHPSEQPFSAGDLYTESKLNVPILMVITDRYTYTLQPLSGWADPTELKTFYQERSQYYSNWTGAYLENTYRYSANKLLSEPERPDDGSFGWFCDHEVREALLAGQTSDIGINIGVWYLNEVLKETAQKFNLLYTRELTDEFDFMDASVFCPARITKLRAVALKARERWRNAA